MAKLSLLSHIIVSLLLLTVFGCYEAAVIHKQTLPKGIGTFWQITDIHWDLRYSIDGDTGNMCHEAPQPSHPAQPMQHIPFQDHNVEDRELHPNDVIKQRIYQSHNTGESASSSDHAELRRDRQVMEETLFDQGDAPASGMMVSSINNGNYGNYLCDSPWSLVHESLDAMVSLHPNPEFILWTGDMGPHVSDPEPHFCPILLTIANVTRELRHRFSPDVAILPVLGNHDAFPKNSYPDCPREFYIRYLDEGGWRDVLSPAQQETFANGGYYSYTAPSGLQVLVVNTNMYYMFNPLGTSDPDPCHQFFWIRQQLHQARQQQMKVLLSAHSPPGFFERLPVIPFFNVTYNDAYHDLVAEYSDVIHSHVYGHLHTDTFRLFAGENEDTVAFLAPSLTPWQASKLLGGTSINPSLRYYMYDAASVLDYTQYHLNLTKANGGDAGISNERQPSDIDVVDTDATTDDDHLETAGPSDGSESVSATTLSSKSIFITDNVATERTIETSSEGIADNSDDWHRNRDLKSLHYEEATGRGSGPQWEVYYRASDAYALSRLDATNMKQLLHNLKHDDKLFNEYYLRNSAGIDNGECNDICRLNQLCSIRYIRVKDLLQCTKYTKTFFRELLSQNFKKINADDYSHFFTDESVLATAIPPVSMLPVIGSEYTGKNNISTTVLLNNEKVTTDEHQEVFIGTSVDNVISSSNTVEESTSHSDINEGNGDVDGVGSEVGDDGSSNITNPHMSHDNLIGNSYSKVDGTDSPTGLGLGMPVVIMIGCIGVVWLVMALLFGAVRWRRMRNNRWKNSSTALYTTRPSHDGYTPVYGDEH